MVDYVKQLISSREVLYNLTLREVRGQYKRTVLGQLWSLANPLAAMLIYTFIFSFLFRLPLETGEPSGLKSYALWLLIGLLPWMFFSRVMNMGTGVLVINAPLIQKVYFPRAIMPLSLVGVVGFNWLFEMGVLIVALLVAGAFVIPWVPFVLLVMVLLALFAAGVAMIFAVTNAHFRDVEHAVTVFTQIWLYMSPVIYPISLVETQSERLGGLFGTPLTLLDLYCINPIVSFVTAFRDLLYDNKMPGWEVWAGCTFWGFAAFILGIGLFAKYEKRLAEIL
jgi:ABC-2 type transport system permease protein